jgi:peptide methionine sulfoxide reductase MsrA
VHGAFCFWCVVAALATFAGVSSAVPETMAAAHHVVR